MYFASDIDATGFERKVLVRICTNPTKSDYPNNRPVLRLWDVPM